MAKQLYDYWFVQFDFPNKEGKPYKSSGGKMVWNDKLKREIPEGWEVCNLSDYLHVFTERVSAGAVNENTNYAPIEVLPRRKMSFNECAPIENAVSGLCMFKKKNILLSNRRVYFHKVCIAAFDGITRDTVIVLEPINTEMLGYTYQLVNDDVFIEFATRHSYGSEQPVLSWESAKTYKVLRPNFSLDSMYSKHISSLIDCVIKNELEIATLTKQRDELLQLLMNGQVSVNYDLAKHFTPQFADSYYHSLKNSMKQDFIQSVLGELCKVLDSQQVEYVGDILEQSLHNLDIVERVSNDERISQENGSLLLSFLSAKKIEGCSAKTIKYYQATVEHLFDEIGKPISDITTNDIRSYLAQYQERKQSSKVTIDNMRRIFSSFFAWLEDEDYILKSPVRRIHKVRTDSLVKEVINDECMELLRDSCTEIRDLAIIDLLASTGMRVGELVQMNIGDIDFQERQCKVFGKGNKEREVYFNARAKIHLQQYVAQRRDDNPALFVSLSSPHKRLSISGVEVRLRTLGKRLNLSKIHPHKFRRTLATMAIDKGMPIEQVQRLLGHVKIDTTLHYAMVNQNNVKISHRRYIG